MAKHVWLITPNERRARQLSLTILAVLRSGETYDRAFVVAGYHSERLNQSDDFSLDKRLAGVRHNKWRIMSSPLVPNYRLVVENHAPMMVEILKTVSAKIVGLDADAPFQIVADACTDYAENRPPSVEREICLAYRELVRVALNGKT